ncbi:type II toxin-antitoxin system VapC family toxin [Stutzerimonas azotifigens]|uniref:type II toxin-antitoxin system VapC family toxin n=1 Tax=Stutzerimonas azotifigens TaxID=291995 RepID=UPI0004834A07|nr:type II toxin-antitoxin system VapC family toxin [Stutzerimonas azotifigens]
MRILLDTHVLLWALADDQKLSRKARRLIEDASEAYISAASFWELAIKISLGKIDADLDEIRCCCRESGFIELPVAVEHVMAIREVESHHRDPFDRILVATTITEPMHLLTADSMVARYTSLAILV